MRSEDMANTSEYRKNQRALHERLHETGRPLFITNHGKPEAVVLSPSVYDELADLRELRDSLASIDRSVQQLDAGHGVDAQQALRDLAAKHGLSIER